VESGSSGGCSSSRACPLALSEDLRAELAAIAPVRGCDRLAELSALFHTAGSVHLLGRGEIAVHLDVSSSAVARRAFTLLRDLGVHSEIRTYRQQAFGKATRYQLHVLGDEPARAVLREAGVLDRAFRPLERPPRRLVARACCRGAYLRGALLGSGSLSGPHAPHLEIRTAGPDGAAFIRATAAASGVSLGVVDRGGHVAVYAKGSEAIEGLLLAAGAGDTVLALEERSVLAALRAQANRLANADHANLVRTTRAAQAQLDAVRRLVAAGTLDRLPDRLQEAGRLRLRHPTLPLAELARRAEPPASKAGMYRRLRKLQELAEA
jgi:cell division protein WhiA